MYASGHVPCECVCLYVAWLAACAVLVHSTLIRAIQANNKTVKNVFMASAEKPIPSAGLRNSPPRKALSLG